MFGYIRPLKDELKVKEYRLYRSYYCGYCKYLARDGGFILRLLLNHDLVFFNLLLSSLWEEEERVFCRCLLHPFRFPMIEDDTLFAATAPINILLLYYKQRNNLQEGWSWGSYLLTFLLQRKVSTITKKNQEMVSVLEKELQLLKEREEGGCTDLDKICEPFAHLLGYLFSMATPQKDQGRILEWMGFNMGKWIYLLDAYDDLTEDKKKGDYNPFFTAFFYQGEDLVGFRQKIQTDVMHLLRYCHHQLIQAFQLLDMKKNQGLLENILYLGLPRQMEEIILEGGCKCGKGSVPGSWYQKRCLER